MVSVGSVEINKYDLLALEQSHEGLTEERVLLAFQAFDELIPNLGVFTRIFQKLRGDLFEAVYSKELTGKKDIYGNNEYIQRLPYFSLVRQVYDERHELAEALKEQLDIVQKSLFDKEKQLEAAQVTISDKEDLINTLTSIKEDLELTIENKDSQFAELKEKLEKTTEASRVKEHHLICDIGELKDSLEEAKKEINFLSKFKKGYDDLSIAFMDKKDIFEDEHQIKRKSFLSTKRSNLLCDIASGRKLEEQILTVINITIEEYDKIIEGHKLTLLENVFNNHGAPVNQELDLMDQELEDVQINFQRSISNLLTELQLLQQHNLMLADQLQKFEKIKTNCIVTEEKDFNSEKSSLYDHLMEMQAAELDPFIAHENVFSKYAAMIFTSNNSGKTYEELENAKFCVSCGEKTVICPHKIYGPDHIFILPPNCSHVKLTRPKVRISKQFLNDIPKHHSHKTTLDVASLESNGVSGCIHDQLHSKSSTKSASEIIPVKDGSGHMDHNILRLLDNYRQRTKTERTLPRLLDLERTCSLMEQFLGYLIWTDEYVTDKEANLSILDMFYSFMHSRYLLEDVMFMATHDFLSAVMKFSEVDKMIQLFANVLSGSLDASCLRYTLLMFDFISAVAWKEVEDFRPFSSVVYPFLNEDDIESLQMSYTSYSENKISSLLVSSFIINIIQNNKEPRFQNAKLNDLSWGLLCRKMLSVCAPKFESKLAGHKCAERGQLKDNEFKEVLDNLLPLCNELTRRRLYSQSAKAVAAGGIVGAVPIVRLAQISGYLELYQITPMVKEHVTQRIYSWRERPRSAATALNQAATTVPEIMSQDKLLTMGCLKQFAANLNRQVKQRKERKSLDAIW